MEPLIHIAFRFHGNFYHSYRGDTPDELGFGKDIRIIRYILEVLDQYNEKGMPVCGTWDFENYFSLEKIMPEYCPDIIEAFQRRVKSGMDEMEFMSYNNGLMNAHTAREFEENMRRAISNASGSGLRDLFGENYENMVRPQEMMYSPIHLKLYKALGIDSISLYYSSVPFNGFSNFIPQMDTRERYNPLTLTYPGIDETMILLPAYNVGDMADNLTLRRWVKKMRRAQLAMKEPCDLLLLIDQDADDQFWYGFDVPAWLKKSFSTVRGLPGLLDNVKDLDYIKFTTPGRYLKDHQPVKSISFGQDTADGSFDGLSSWAEKWSNHELFTGLERARILDLQTRRLAAKAPASVQKDLQDAFEARLKILSTTHFGMAAPVLNLTREKTARKLVAQAVQSAASAFEQVAVKQAQGTFKLLDYVRGESTDLIQYKAHPSQALVRLPMEADVEQAFTLQDAEGKFVPSAVLEYGGKRELVFVDRFEAEQEKSYRLVNENNAETVSSPVTAAKDLLQNGLVKVSIDPNGQITSLQVGDREVSAGQFLTSTVTYKDKLYSVNKWTEIEAQASGPVGLVRMQGRLTLPGEYTVEFERELLMAAGLPYLYVNLHIRYPRTPDQGYGEGTAKRLQQKWDNNWQEVMPCEISPALLGKSASPLRVWKHNYCDHISTFDLDYGSFSPNKSLPNVNNQITHAWVAVSDGSSGLLLAQNADVSSNIAFCPLRTKVEGKTSRVLLNPFGTYYGRQYHYQTADTNLGNLMAVRFSAADQLKSYAPSYNGREQSFSLLIAPYQGNEPPESICHDAEAFAYPYAVLDDGKTISAPAHRSWSGKGLGKTPGD